MARRLLLLRFTMNKNIASNPINQSEVTSTNEELPVAAESAEELSAEDLRKALGGAGPSRNVATCGDYNL